MKSYLVSMLVGFITMAAVIDSAAPPASAQSTRSYDISHGFWIQPSRPAFLNLAVWRDFEHAWARQPGFASQASWNPGAQLPGFRPFGIDWQDARGRVHNSGGVPVLEGVTASIGPWPFQRSNTVSASSGSNSAIASSSVSINEFIPGGPLFGNIRSTGTARAQGLGSAYAFSSSSVSMWGLTADWRQGRIRWTPSFSDSVSGSALAVGQPPRPRDPIVVTMVDEFDQTLLEETLVDVVAIIKQGDDAAVLWDDGRLSITNALNGEFLIDMSNFLIDPGDRGRVRLAFDNGIITESDVEGRFEGLGLPGPGESSTFDIPFPAELEFAYEVPDLAPTLEFHWAQGIVPEPATLVLLAFSGLALLRQSSRSSHRR